MTLLGGGEFTVTQKLSHPALFDSTDATADSFNIIGIQIELEIGFSLDAHFYT